MRGRAGMALRWVVDIRPGEWLMALVMALHLLLVIATFAVVKPVRSSLFLEHFGASNLPYIYIATALFAGSMTWMHFRLLDRVDVVRLQVFTYLFFIMNLGLFWWAFRADSPWLSAVFFIWVNVFTITVNTLFWMSASHYYHAREAKRLYGFINAGGTVGGMASGTAVAVTVRHVGTENMLVACSLILAACIALAVVLGRLGRERLADRRPDAGAEDPEPAGPAPESEASLPTLFRFAYPRYIAAALGVSLVVSILIDFQFNTVVERVFTEKDGRTAFFSGFMVWINGLALVMQLVFTSHFLRRLGIGAAVLLLPLAMLGGSVWMLLAPGLIAAMVLKAADGSVRYSIEQSARDILYLPLSRRLMGKLKSFVDVFVQRLAKGIGSIIILVVTAWWAFGFEILSVVTAALACGWVAIAWLLRREYGAALRRFLATEIAPAEGYRLPARLLDQATTADLVAALRAEDEERALLALELLEGSREEAVVRELRVLARQAPPRLQARALHLLADAGDTALLTEAERLLGHGAIEAKPEAVHYLCAGAPDGMMSRLPALLASDDLSVRAAALACAANCGGPMGEQIARDVFAQLLSERAGGQAARAIAARALAHIKPPSALHDRLSILLQDRSPRVVQEALAAAAVVRRRDWVPVLVERLGDPAVARQALAALQAYGDRVLGTVRDCLEDASLPLAARGRLPRLFAATASERAARDLLDLLPRLDLRLRRETLKALNGIRLRRPDLRLERSVLEAVLADEVRAAYELLKGH